MEIIKSSAGRWYVKDYQAIQAENNLTDDFVESLARKCGVCIVGKKNFITFQHECDCKKFYNLFYLIDHLPVDLKLYLHQQKAFERFINNCNPNNSYEYDNPNILNVFYWGNSNEGHEFWYNLNRKYYENKLQEAGTDRPGDNRSEGNRLRCGGDESESSVDGTFQDAYLSTIGFDYKNKTVTLKSGKKVKIQIWDTAGQERFRILVKSYYKGAHGVVLIYDVTSKSTFDGIKKWISQIKDEASSKIRIVLIANKIDSDERVVNTEEGEQLANSYNLDLFEASAKDNINVSEAFQDITEKIDAEFKDYKSQGQKLNDGKKKKGCCN